MVGVELLQGGVELSRGWFPKNKWEGLPLLQVFGGFGEVALLYLSAKDESETLELFRSRVLFRPRSWYGGLSFYLPVFLLPFLLLLFCALAHLLQRGRCERPQELSTNRGQQRGEAATPPQRGANGAIVLQLFPAEQENKRKIKNIKNKSGNWRLSENDILFTAAS